MMPLPWRRVGSTRPSSVSWARWAGRIQALQQLQLILAGIHVDEIDDDHATDVASFSWRAISIAASVGPYRLAGGRSA